MVLSIVASLGQLTSALNTAFAPPPQREVSTGGFDRSLTRIADRTQTLPHSPDPSYLDPRMLSTYTGGTPDKAGVLAILRQYPPTNEGIRAAMPQLQRAYPGVQLLDHPQRLDKLAFPDGTIVDTIIGAGAPGSSWGWLVEEYGGGHLGGAATVDLGGLDVPHPGHMTYEYDWVPSTVIDTLTFNEVYTPGRFRHQLSGFNDSKIGPNHVHSMNLKYIAARVFEQIDVYDAAALDTAVQMLRGQGFDATKVDDDKIDFGDGQGPIDVIQNMSSRPTNLAWQWLA